MRARTSLVAAFLLTIVSGAFAENVLESSVSLGLDMVADESSVPVVSASPWALADFSVAGYPTALLSWFTDAALRGSYAPAESRSGLTAIILSGASLRSGLSTVRFDLQTLFDVASGDVPMLFEISPIFSFSTGSASYSAYAEAKGVMTFEAGSGSVYRSVGAMIGAAATLGARWAPSAELSCISSVTAAEPAVQRIGVSVAVPWYPTIPATVDFGAALVRSFGGSPVVTPAEAVYYPAEQWKYSANASLGYALSRALSIDLSVATSLARMDHRVLIDGEPTGPYELVANTSAVASTSIAFGSRWSAGIEIAGEIDLTNSGEEPRLAGYCTIESRYRF